MSVGNLPTQGDKKNNWTWQNAVLQLLGTISTNTGVAPGDDYELVTTYYVAIANGPGFVIGNSITRTQIYLMPAGTLAGTIWFNQSTGLTIAAPPIASIEVVMPATAVTVNNLPVVLGQALMANSLAVTIASNQSALAVTNANLDVLLSTRATEATLATMLTLAGFQARINTLGQKTMAASTPVVLASDQTSIPVTLGAGVSRTPSLVNVPPSTALTNTTAGVRQLSLRVVAGANATIGGVTVPNGTTVTYSAAGNDTIGAISYSTGAGTRILISYLI